MTILMKQIVRPFSLFKIYVIYFLRPKKIALANLTSGYSWYKKVLTNRLMSWKRAYLEVFNDNLTSSNSSVKVLKIPKLAKSNVFPTVSSYKFSHENRPLKNQRKFFVSFMHFQFDFISTNQPQHGFHLNSPNQSENPRQS